MTSPVAPPEPDATDPLALDCQACGACCHGDEGWVHVGADDDDRVDAAPELAAHVVLTRHGGYVKRSLRMVGGRCAALATTASGVTCSIYAVRPSVCRELTSGSPACHAARRARGLE